MAKKYQTDYGNRRDWRLRVGDTILKGKEEGDFIYIVDTLKEVSPEDVKKENKLINRVHDSTTDAQMMSRNRKLEKFRETMKSTIILRYKSLSDSDKHSSTKRMEAVGADLSLFPLGFVNETRKDGEGERISSKCRFYSRIPTRQQKQGFSSFNSMQRGLGRKQPTKSPWPIYRPETLKMLRGEYPSLEKCFENLFSYEGSNSAAFDREFAISVDEIGHVTLFYRGFAIGMLHDEEKREFLLVSKYEYLTERLLEIGVALIGEEDGRV